MSERDAETMTCKEHQWPKLAMAMSLRSIGTTKIEQCNNCLAIRVTQEDGCVTRTTVVDESEQKDREIAALKATVAELQAAFAAGGPMPMQSAVDKRCSTCAYGEPRGDAEERFHDCHAPMPAAVKYRQLIPDACGGWCPCWRAKP